MPTEEEITAYETQFIDSPAVNEKAAVVIDRTRVSFSDERYRAAGKKLEFSWLPNDAFRAWAARRPGTPPIDEIAISYGAAQEIYRDAFVLPLVCERHLNTAHYEPIYSGLAYGDGIVRVLPADLTTEDATLRIMNSLLAWVYLHEQSHLFQNHGPIARATGASWVSCDNKLDEMRDVRGSLITGESAVLSHVFELAADHEATNNIVGLLLKANRDLLPASSLWALVVGLICMFQRFYGLADRTFQSEAQGSHPDPSFRICVLLRGLFSLIMHPKVRKFVPWLSEQKDLVAVVDHAVVTATMYCQIRYREGHGVSAFLHGVHGGDVPVGYQQSLFDMWTKVRPTILQDY
jgi:hypothetical protein